MQNAVLVNEAVSGYCERAKTNYAPKSENQKKEMNPYRFLLGKGSNLWKEKMK
jgi:hypothetical protein